MKRDDRSPAHYIDSVEGEQKQLLLSIRALIQSVAPDAEEYIEYGMLGYGEVANLAAQKNYVSLYVSPKALAEYKKKHATADCGKSCLRFKSVGNFDSVAVKDLLTTVQKMILAGEDTGCC